MNRQNNRHLVRGIYLLPNLFTVAALFAGFYAIIAATHAHFFVSACAIFIAMLFDALDGRIARMTNTQTEFGAQMDSLSDMVCFGVTPALVLYMWSLQVLGKLGWLIAFLYVVCTALRLARFNAQTQSDNKRFFQGLPTPAAAGAVAGLVATCAELQIYGPQIAKLVMCFTVVLGLLKVSTLRYRSFKDVDIRHRVPFIIVLLIVLALVVIAYQPTATLFCLFLIYVVTGPVSTVWGLRRFKQRKQRGHGDE